MSASENIVFTDVMVLLSRLKVIERVRYMAEKLETLSESVIVDPITTENVTETLTKEMDNLSLITFHATQAYDEAKAAILAKVPCPFKDDNSLTELGENILLLVTMLSKGEPAAVLEVLILLYSTFKEEVGKEEVDKRAGDVLTPVFLAFAKKFFKETKEGTLELSDTANQRIEGMVTQFKQSSGFFNFQVPEGRTVH